jgi:hypothetical protein
MMIRIVLVTLLMLCLRKTERLDVYLFRLVSWHLPAMTHIGSWF